MVTLVPTIIQDKQHRYGTYRCYFGKHTVSWIRYTFLIVKQQEQELSTFHLSLSRPLNNYFESNAYCPLN